MSTLLTSKGQVTIPKKVRSFLGLEPGSAVDFRITEAGQVVLAPAEAKQVPSRFSNLRGTATVKMSTDEIMALTRGED